MNVNVKITHAMATQLRAYINARDQEGWYYGNKEQFEARHLKLIAALDMAIHRAIKKNPAADFKSGSTSKRAP